MYIIVFRLVALATVSFAVLAPLWTQAAEDGKLKSFPVDLWR